MARASEHTYTPGEVVIRQDDAGGAAYVIISGRVRLVESVPDSPMEMFLGELGPGEIFGEIGGLRYRPGSASVVTLERTRCVSIPTDDFMQMLRESPELSMALLRVLAGRLYEADRLLARYAPDPVTGLPGRRAFQEAYRRLSPHPEHFDDFLTMLSHSNADTRGWSDEQLAAITAPTLLVLGDRDFTTVEHGALMQQLIPGSQLAVLPGTTHMQVTRRADLLLPMLVRGAGGYVVMAAAQILHEGMTGGQDPR